MQSGERRALVLLLSLAVAGHAVRLVAARPSEAPGGVELVKLLPAQSPLAHKESTLALARPLAEGERIDLNRASADEIGRLPRVGPALAKRIVADRAARGPFGNLEALDRVPGVGPSLLAQVGEHVAFGGMPGAAPGGGNARSSGTGCRNALSGCSERDATIGTTVVNPNTATASELEALPGVGARRAAAIVQDREHNGPFATLEALTRVPGIKSALVGRLRQRLQVP